MSWLRCTPMMWMMIERAAAGSRILRASPLCKGTDLDCTSQSHFGCLSSRAFNACRLLTRIDECSRPTNLGVPATSRVSRDANGGCVWTSDAFARV